MRVMREKIGEVHRFKCTGCGSQLETETSDDLIEVDRNLYSYDCPVCHLTCTVGKAYVKKVNVYNDSRES